MRPSRLAFAGLIAGGALLPSLSVAGAPGGPVGAAALTLVGSEAVKVRIFQSDIRSCDERESAKVYEGVVEPGTTVVVAPGCCLCVQQTHAPLINVGWTPGTIACRFPGGKMGRKYCVEADLQKQLAFTLSSRE